MGKSPTTKNRILAALETGPKTTATLSKLIGGSRQNLSQVLRRAKAAGLIVNARYGVWALPGPKAGDLSEHINAIRGQLPEGCYLVIVGGEGK